MNGKVLIVAIYLVKIIYELFKIRIADLQRKKPLPEEVSDIYDAQRYQSYLDRTAENRALHLYQLFCETVINIVILYSGLFNWSENKFYNHPYQNYLAVMIIVFTADTIIGFIFNYISTFKIDEKYGLNKKDIKEFIREEVINDSSELLLSGIIYLLLIYIFTHIGKWTDNFSLSTGKTVVIGIIIAAAIGIVILLVALLSIAVMKVQYVFTPLEEGQLKEKINALQKDCKKKVKIFNVYNESKKSVSKNAFVLKVLWHREYGIADNFINENSQRELLAVLAHETGHLKHRNNLLDYSKYFFLFIVFMTLIYFMKEPELIFTINAWLRSSFNLTENSYYVIFMFYESVFTPLMKIFTIYSNYIS